MTMTTNQPISVNLDDVLAAIDPRDSEASLALWDWLQKNGRVHKVGALDEVGYLYVYQEPKGSTRAGYAAGGTTGDRIVEEALAQARATSTPLQTGICSGCYSAIRQAEGDESPALQDPAEGEVATTCPAGGSHQFA